MKFLKEKAKRKQGM